MQFLSYVLWLLLGVIIGFLGLGFCQSASQKMPDLPKYKEENKVVQYKRPRGKLSANAR
jgi:hypothetical protein